MSFFVSSNSIINSELALSGSDHVVTGNLHISGAIYAQQYVVESTEVIVSKVEQYGSTTFGDSTGDHHAFKGTFGMTGSIIPSADSTYNLGSASKRFANVYTGDLHLRNKEGDWTIYEKRDKLVVKNNITGKLYEMVLKELTEEE